VIAGFDGFDEFYALFFSKIAHFWVLARTFDVDRTCIFLSEEHRMSLQSLPMSFTNDELSVQ